MKDSPHVCGILAFFLCTLLISAATAQAKSDSEQAKQEIRAMRDTVLADTPAALATISILTTPSDPAFCDFGAGFEGSRLIMVRCLSWQMDCSAPANRPGTWRWIELATRPLPRCGLR